MYSVYECLCMISVGIIYELPTSIPYQLRLITSNHYGASKRNLLQLTRGVFYEETSKQANKPLPEVKYRNGVGIHHF